MDGLLIAAAVLLAVGVLWFTLNVPPEAGPVSAEPPSPARRLEERKAAIYESLRDLVFEFRTGKLSEPDYRATREELQRELAAVNAELERLVGKASAAAPEASAPVPAVSAMPEGVVCPGCGAHFSRPMKFCGECGRPLSGETS